jgi:hypothetical protein
MKLFIAALVLIAIAVFALGLGQTDAAVTYPKSEVSRAKLKVQVPTGRSGNYNFSDYKIETRFKGNQRFIISVGLIANVDGEGFWYALTRQSRGRSRPAIDCLSSTEVWQNGNRTGCLSAAGAIVPGRVYDVIVRKSIDKNEPYTWAVSIPGANAHSDIGHTLGWNRGKPVPSRVEWTKKTSNVQACGDFQAQPPGLTVCADPEPPQADAGPDQTVNGSLPIMVTLDGRGSSGASRGLEWWRGEDDYQFCGMESCPLVLTVDSGFTIDSQPGDTRQFLLMAFGEEGSDHDTTVITLGETQEDQPDGTDGVTGSDTVEP